MDESLYVDVYGGNKRRQPKTKVGAKKQRFQLSNMTDEQKRDYRRRVAATKPRSERGKATRHQLLEMIDEETVLHNQMCCSGRREGWSSERVRQLYKVQWDQRFEDDPFAWLDEKQKQRLMKDCSWALLQGWICTVMNKSTQCPRMPSIAGLEMHPIQTEYLEGDMEVKHEVYRLTESNMFLVFASCNDKRLGYYFRET